MSLISLRAAVLAGVGAVVSLVVAASAIAVLAASLGEQPPPTTGADCLPPGGASGATKDAMAGPLATEGDNHHSQPAPAGTVLAEATVDVNAISDCGAVVEETTTGTNQPGAPAQAQPGGG